LFFCVFGGALAAAVATLGQQRAVAVTADQDNQNMMDHLGITLHPGSGGDEKAPNHANYDESKTNPFPVFPIPSR